MIDIKLISIWAKKYNII